MLNTQNKKGFSLAEMMVVMLMLSIIFAAAAPILTKRAAQTAEVVSGGDATPAGVITAFGGTAAPEGWVLCDGSSYSTSGKYEKLYNAIKYVYGGSGTTFNVPDLKGRMPIGQDVTNSVITSGSAKTLGTKSGEENHTLSVSEMPSHNHSTPITLGHQETEDGYITVGSTYVRTSTYKSSSTGGSVSHNNMQPYLVANYIIKY